MLNKKRYLLVIGLSLLSSTSSALENRFQVQYFQGTSNTTFQSISSGNAHGLGVNYSRLINWPQNLPSYLNTHLSASFKRLHGTHYGEKQTQDISDIALEIEYPINANYKIEGRFGGSYLSNDNFKGADIDAQYNFSLGLNLIYDLQNSYDIMLSYRHHSNARTNFPNTGLDFYGAGFRYKY